MRRKQKKTSINHYYKKKTENENPNYFINENPPNCEAKENKTLLSKLHTIKQKFCYVTSSQDTIKMDRQNKKEKKERIRRNVKELMQ